MPASIGRWSTPNWIGPLIHTGDSTQPVVSARTVYVCIAADGSGKIEPPQVLLDALGVA
ncbi:hypothetical protein [Mycolicibacterium sp. CBMA 361]|uniref:hypothetical protein n=1 Tax=Mycolicibacterium sp. CBMA 361 TaxID=2606610 RepID=UPI0012DCEFD1|nr:hypothetical protein [Mycolicibacterium sp. CBMA 361]